MLIFVILCSLTFLFNFHYSEMPPRRHTPQKKWTMNHLSPKEKVIIRGFVFGQKPRKKEFKKAIKNLNIYHLFTPSGLHLSSLLWFFSFLSLKRVVLFALFPLVVFVDGFFAFKRVYFIKFTREVLGLKKIVIEGKYLFLFVFLIEFVFRVHLNPLSFTYSFLFLGIIYSLKNSSPLILLAGLWFAQCLVSCFTTESFYLFALPLNSVITILVSFFYPLILINTFIPIGFCNYFYDLILACGDFVALHNIQVNTVQTTILLAMLLVREVRRPGVAIVGFISTTLY